VTTGDYKARAVGLLLLVAAAWSGTPREGEAAWKPCRTEDREALLVGALGHEIQNTLYEAEVYRTQAKCVAVGLGDRAPCADPPRRVMLRLKKMLRTRVTSVSQASKCEGAVVKWVAEPVCHGVEAYVRTRNNEHCPIPYRRLGDRWEEQLRGACE
jgi:hypothetical protein